MTASQRSTPNATTRSNAKVATARYTPVMRRAEYPTKAPAVAASKVAAASDNTNGTPQRKNAACANAPMARNAACPKLTNPV